MKVAFLSFYSGKIDRGVEVATAALAQELSKNHEITVFQAGSQTVLGVEVVQIPAEKKWPTDSSQSPWRFLYLDYYSRKILLFTVRCLPFLFKKNYDVVIPTNGGWQLVLLRFFTWFTRKKLVVQGNAGIGRDDYWQLMWRPDHFVAISPQGFASATQEFPSQKISYITYGVDLKLFSKTKPREVKLKKPVVLCVAAFIPLKQIDLLISAMEKVPEASLLVIGQGPLEKELRLQGQKQLGARFLLKTGIGHDELIGFYKAADVFSLPSKSTEAFGIVYIEALAAGLTLVAPDDNNRREIIGSSGIFVDPTDRQAYADALQKALKTNVKNQAQQQAKQYAWETISQKYETLLKSL